MALPWQRPGNLPTSSSLALAQTPPCRPIHQVLALAVPSSPIHEVLALAVLELVVGLPDQVLAVVVELVVVGAETTPKPTRLRLVLALAALDVGPTHPVLAQLVGGPTAPG